MGEKKYELTQIEWLDSYGITPDWQEIDNIKPIKIICITVGFVVHEDDTSLSVANSICVDGPENQATGIMTIPKCSIVKKNLLKVICDG